MGIHGLMKLLSEEAPGAIKEVDFTALTGRKVAIDASMAMYQFLVAVRAGGQGSQMNLTNADGEVTSHIQGMFNRTIKMMETGIKPVYVFDGKPPQLKGDELAKRTAKRVKAEADLAAAKEAGAAGDVDRFNRRLVKVGRSQNDDCKTLLRLMGVPVLTAPCEAEAQCAELAKKGKVYATATEDMDALTFRTPKLLRKLTYSQGGGKTKDGKAREKQPVIEIDTEKVLTEMGLSYEQFVDLCILCGCDYSSTIKGVGPKTGQSLCSASAAPAASAASSAWSASNSFPPPLLIYSLSPFHPPPPPPRSPVPDPRAQEHRRRAQGPARQQQEEEARDPRRLARAPREQEGPGRGRGGQGGAQGRGRGRAQGQGASGHRRTVANQGCR